MAMCASAFMTTPYAVKAKTCATTADADLTAELERLRQENQNLKELQRLREENKDIRAIMPKDRFFDRFFSPRSPLGLIEEMDELLHSSTSLLGGLMNSMLQTEPFFADTAEQDVAKVQDVVKLELEKSGELTSNVVVDPPASRSYSSSTINGKVTKSVSLIQRAHAKDDTGLSGIVRTHATIDDKGQVQIEHLELNKNLIVKKKADDAPVVVEETKKLPAEVA